MKHGNQKKIEYKVDKNGCYICISHCRNSSGYPHAMRNGKLQLISHIIYERAYGPIPDGLILRHICDTLACINPEHLLIGTQLDNMQDMIKRGRSNTGIKHPNCKLTEEQVKEIKYNRVNSCRELGHRYNIHYSQINRIRNNVAWKESV